MSLVLKTSYEKDGKEILLKTPKMKVIGKDMDEDETHTFIVLADGITVWDQGKYPNYQMFVKYEDQDTAFNLDLSQQAYGEIKKLIPSVGDRLIITKEMREIKDGVLHPSVKATIEGREPVQNPENEVIPRVLKMNNEDSEFAKEYKSIMGNDKMTEETRNENCFIGTYFRTKYKDQLQPLVELYNKEGK